MTKEKLQDLSNSIQKAMSSLHDMQQEFTGMNKADDEKYNFSVRELNDIETMLNLLWTKYAYLGVQLELEEEKR